MRKLIVVVAVACVMATLAAFSLASASVPASTEATAAEFVDGDILVFDERIVAVNDTYDVPDILMLNEGEYQVKWVDGTIHTLVASNGSWYYI